MIDPTVLRQSVNEHLQNHLAYPADVVAWVMKCGDLLDENAALREKVKGLDERGWELDSKLRAAESRLAALKEAGNAVVEEAKKGCSVHEVWDALEASIKRLSKLLRSDP